MNRAVFSNPFIKKGVLMNFSLHLCSFHTSFEKRVKKELKKIEFPPIRARKKLNFLLLETIFLELP